MRLLLAIAVSCAAVIWSAQASAEDAYYQVPVNNLKLPEGPHRTNLQDWRYWWRTDVTRPYAVLDGEGEAFVSLTGEEMSFSPWPPPPVNGIGPRASVAQDVVLVHTGRPRDISGRLFWPKADRSGMVALKFTVPAAEAKADARVPFYRAKGAHYERLLNREIPGGAWFRHQERDALAAMDVAQRQPLAQRQNWRRGRGLDNMDNTYALFSGGRALSENLQLQRAMPATPANSTPVKIDSIQGISVAGIDWTPLVKGLKPELDPLASRVPADQYAVFFPTFAAAVATADEADRQGTPVLQMAEPRSEDAQVSKRYQRQLGLSLSGLGRLLGPHVVQSVALTGSDPYFRIGTDVAVLFQAPNAAILEQLLLMQVALAAAGDPQAKPASGQVQGVHYQGYSTADRRISSYVARLDGAVVVTNSLDQLDRLARVHSGKAKSIAALPEFTFFRQRYRRGDAQETALVFLSDATIRRWCSPRGRIGDSRRTRVAAVLAELQAAQLDRLVRNKVQPGAIYTDLEMPPAGELSLTPQGVRSSLYGSLEFMTPIGELPLDEVTRAEADSYQRWRDGYQRNWSWAFDPIALRLTFSAGRLAADLTVMPLIAGSEYREMLAVSRGAQLAPDAGDRHDALAHLVLAINTKSPTFQQWGNFVTMMRQGLTLGWLGSSVSVYLDDDPVWQEVAKLARDRVESEHVEELIEKKINQVPIAVRAEVSDGLKLALFLTSARAFIEQTAPGLLRWESLQYHDQPYVKVTSTENGRPMGFPRNVSIYYAATGDSLLLTLNEPLLKRALDRQAGRQKQAQEGKKAAAPAQPWLGSNFAAEIDRKGMGLLAFLLGDEHRQAMQTQAWGNLPILNEWKRRYPDRDPLELHQRLFQARLLCPGGGKYVWNEKWQTMESTVYGHPGEPKPGPAAPPALEALSRAAFGLSFEEHDGLRARVRLEKK